jgi:AcrR family transcriptional regulator
MPKTPRPYASPVREQGASLTRKRLIDAAAQLLRTESDFRSVTLDAVARAAGVTRLTVYHQFGSRRGLLEAVLDDLAAGGGLGRIRTAMQTQDPEAAIKQLVAVFCGFWGSDPAIVRLNEAAGADFELAEAVAERNDRRRDILRELVSRYCAGKRVSPRRRADMVDVLFGLTGCSMFAALSPNRSPAAVCKLLQATVAAVLLELR